MTLGHDLVGTGPTPVIVTNDWLCDTSTWDGARPYLDRARFTYAFADLRGYGRSRDRSGAFTLVEAAADVLDLATALGWPRFAIVGHSMSTLVAVHLACRSSGNAERGGEQAGELGPSHHHDFSRWCGAGTRPYIGADQ